MSTSRDRHAPRRRRAEHAARALTLLELMIVLAVTGVVIALAAPSMREMIGMQRLRGIGAQVLTDFAYARSEAVSRNQFVGFLMRNSAGDANTCYVIFTSSVNPLSPFALDPTRCNCNNAPGNVCNGTQRELRTVQVPRNQSIELRVEATQPTFVAFDPVSGAIRHPPAGSASVFADAYCVEATRTPRGRIVTGVNISGRPFTCTPDGSVSGLERCPAYAANQYNCRLIP